MVFRSFALSSLLVSSVWLAPIDRASAQTAGDPVAGEAAPNASRDAEARGLFEAGRAAFTDGRFEDALRYFQQSHELSHRDELLYNIGSAADRLQREQEALAAFEGYVRGVPDAPNRREVEGRIRVLRARVEREAADAAAAAAARDATTAPVYDPLTDPSQQPQPDDGPGIVGEWWFWTIIVGVVAAGVLTGVLIGTTGGTTYPPYMTGDAGAIAFTLTVPIP